MFPVWDRPTRDARFAALRAAQVRAEAGLSPTQRFACLDEMRRFAEVAGGPIARSPTDEPMELWRAVRAKLAR